MDPYTEQRLREEVMYLHSLWHQGPPLSSSINSPNPINPNPDQRTGLKSTPAAQLNTVKKKMMKKKMTKKLPPSSQFEWPCNEIAESPHSSSGWPIFNPAKTKPVRLPTTLEQTLIDGIKVQQKALQVFKEFFTRNEDSDGYIDSDDDSEDDSEDDDDDDTMDEDGNAQYNFFVKVFEENGELRGYYEKNNENGEFSCLVCGGIGVKVGKRFKNCVSLVQHSLTIAKTKKKKAHRAYSQVVCKVLGWDINRLPSVPLPSDKQPNDLKGNAEVAIDSSTNNDKDSTLENADLINSDVNKDEKLPNSVIPDTSSGSKGMPCEGNLGVSIANISISNIHTVLGNVENGESKLKENVVGEFVDVGNCNIPGITDNVNDDMMLCESSLKVGNADTCVENIEYGASNTNGNSSRIVNHLSRNVAKMSMLERK